MNVILTQPTEGMDSSGPAEHQATPAEDPPQGEESQTQSGSELTPETKARLITPTPGKIQYYTGEQLCKMELPPKRDLIAGVIRQPSLCFLGGEEGSGKSLLAMNIAISVAAGLRRFLHFDICEAGKVLFLNNELFHDVVVERLQAMAQRLTADGCLANLIIPDQVPQLDAYMPELEGICATERPKLAVLDCLYFAHSSDENDNSGMKRMMRQLISLPAKYDLVLLVVHHTKKGSRYETMHNDNMRGAGVFGAAADTVILLRRSARDESKRILKPTKLRHGGDELRTARLLSLDPTTLWFSDEGVTDEKHHLAALSQTPAQEDEIDPITLIQPGEEVTREELVCRYTERTGKSAPTADRRLRDAVAARQVLHSKHGKYSRPAPEAVATEGEESR